KRGRHLRQVSHFLKQRIRRGLALLRRVDRLQELRITVQRRHGVLEFVREPSGHLTQAFQVPLQRDLLAQTRDFRDVRYQTERAARSGFRGIDWSHGGAEFSSAAGTIGYVNLFTTKDLAG